MGRYESDLDAPTGGYDKGEDGKMTGKRTITVYGTGCKKCQTLEKNSRAAVEELGIDADVSHVTDIAEIAAADIMSTPAFAIDGQIVSMGKVLDIKTIETLLG